ncbi:hypothetical protein Hypma_004388 [Hypsizygus marmoreus]|uniref:Uncharacterized protein n=1 Tax=Hypsizygus marmoreus TaxID=39966 RepID=A0A369K3G6_HYPMA|nr:hypothetical protein Hypma_004388 [Hypsizygus marmoreus]
MPSSAADITWSMPWGAKCPRPLPSYPRTDKQFMAVQRKTGEKSPHKVSGSKWTGEHLIGLCILVKQTMFCHEQGIADAVQEIEGIKELKQALGALDLNQLRYPDVTMLAILSQMNSMISFTFYASLCEVLATPFRPVYEEEDTTSDESTDEDDPGILARVIAASRGTNTDEDAFVPPPSQGLDRKPAEELVITAGTASLVGWVIAVWGWQKQAMDQDRVRHASVEQTFYSPRLLLGSYSSKTDGSIQEVLVSKDGHTCTRADDVETVVDIEAKADDKTQLLPQHVAELISHMAHRLSILAPTMGKDYTSYKDMSVEQRTAYLLCFNGSIFRTVWMTFRPSFLEWIFGPLDDVRSGKQIVYGKGGIPKPRKPADNLYQDAYVSPPVTLTEVDGRLYVASVIIYFLMKELPTVVKKSRELDADILGCKVEKLDEFDLQ